MNKRETIKQALIFEGIKCDIRGFDFLLDAIEMYSPMKKLTNDIYKAIAEKNNTTISRVERSIRHAVAVKEMTNRGFISKVYYNCIDGRRLGNE